jgi:molybdopterin/thiamine biosynthesis adenylyltransferase
MLQLACAWNLAQPAVHCVAPTLIQESGAQARSIEEKRGELATVGTMAARLSEQELREIREIGENVGCMALKGASVEHEGPSRPDRWGLDEELTAVADRWGIDPSSDLAQSAMAAG